MRHIPMGFPSQTQTQKLPHHSNFKVVTVNLSDSFSVSLCIPLPGTRMANIVDQNDLFVDEYDVSRMTLDQVNIEPTDISPEELKSTVENLNRELNEKALHKRPQTLETYLRFEKQGKNSGGDRKFKVNLENTAHP